MTALAVMIALVGAMFAAFPAAHAATGDVSANTGYCVETFTAGTGSVGADGAASPSRAHYVRMTTAADGPLVTVEVPDRGTSAEGQALESAPLVPYDDTTEPDKIEIPCDSAFAGQAVSISPVGGRTPVVTLASPTVTVSVGDSDGIIAAGGPDLSVKVSFKNLVQFDYNPAVNANDEDGDSYTDDVRVASTAIAADGAQATAVTDSFDNVSGARVLWVRVSGELADADPPTNDWAGGAVSTTLPIPAGTTPGDYTISAAVIYDPNVDDDVTDDDSDGSSTDEDSRVIVATKVITVGEPGINASSASLTLGNASADNPLTTATTGAGELIPEDGTESANGGNIFLKLVTTNSLGNPANDGGLSAVTIIAPGGQIAIHHPNATRTHQAGPIMNGSGPNSATVTMGAEVVNTMFVEVTKADKKPGTVDVYALLIGSDGAPRTDTITLTFTGASSSLVLGTAKPVAPNGKTEFTIDAQDAAGNPGSIGQLSFSVTDSDGKPVGQGPNSKLGVTKNTAGSSTPDEPRDNNGLQTVGLVETMLTTAPGVYTVKVSLAGVADSEAETEVIISGTAANIAMEASATDVELNDIVTVTATVSDKNDAQVADGTEVTWGTFGELTLTRVSGETSKTKDGVATAQFGVSKGTGGARITAISGVASGSVPITGPAGDEAMADEEASVSCLHNLAGFTSWTCDVESSASEIFGLVSGRGVTALHLWNGSAWVRYSVVDGTMVPGSSDFMVAKGDTLYISN